MSLIIKKHLVDKVEIRGYGWEHFKRMYNLRSSMHGYDDFIDNNCVGWNSHVKSFNSIKKDKKSLPTNKNTVAQIKKWLTENKVPFGKDDNKSELLKIVGTQK